MRISAYYLKASESSLSCTMSEMTMSSGYRWFRTQECSDSVGTCRPGSCRMEQYEGTTLLNSTAILQD